MKITALKTNTNTTYLYEGLSPKQKSSVMLWESAGRAIVEAQLTNAQIKQLFQNVEQDLTSAGQNRTAIGKVKDAGSAVAQAYRDLKSKVETSKPMQNADAMYDQAAAKLKQATGGDQGVMQYVQKYRDFAKKHPIAQTLIYSALIAAAGISGAGAGGAAALGLLKMTDKLLQGEKFSSAAIKGAETGALAYGASKLGDLMRGDTTTTTTTRSSMTQHTTGMQPAGDWEIPKQISAKYPADQFDITTDGMGSFEVFTKAGEKIARFNTDPYESVKLTNNQVTQLFETIVIEAGLWDKFKAGAVTVGKNLTTKVTADSLMKKWQAAGMPSDSAEVGKILGDAGVDINVIKTAMQSIGVEPTMNTAPTNKLPDISKLSADQKKRLLAALDQLDKPAAQASLTDLVRQRQSMGMTESAMKKQLKKLLDR